MLQPATGAGEPPGGGNGPGTTLDPAAGGRLAAAHWSCRRRLERQLHDGAALRISALTLQLGLLGGKLPAGTDLQRDIDELQDQLHVVLQELRAVSDQIYPPLLYEAGLRAALGELAARSGPEVHVDAPDERFDAAVEGVAYFTVREVLEGLEAGGPPVRVRLRRDGQGLSVDVAGAAAGAIRVSIPCG